MFAEHRSVFGAVFGLAQTVSQCSDDTKVEGADQEWALRQDPQAASEEEEGPRSEAGRTKPRALTRATP